MPKAVKLNSLAKIQWVIFGGLHSSLLLLMTLAFYVTGYYLGGKGWFWLWQLGGGMLGLNVLIIVYRWKVLPNIHG